jgi:hypothetical protein
MATYLSNSFSLNMLEDGKGHCRAEIVPCDPCAVPKDARSFIGHSKTALLVAERLGRPVAANRATLRLHSGDVLYVAQFRGRRLGEGARELPANAPMVFYRITLR